MRLPARTESGALSAIAWAFGRSESTGLGGSPLTGSYREQSVRRRG